MSAPTAVSTISASALAGVSDLLALIQAMQAGQRRLFSQITWEEYQQLLQAFSNDPKVRLAYDKGTLEIMTYGISHERCKEFIVRLVSVLADELQIDLESVGSTTLQAEKLRSGAEPDTAFYIAHAQQMIGRAELNLSTDPPPDIVVEVDITSPSLNKRSLYARLGIPELWRFDGHELTISLLQEVEYQPSTHSLAFPFLQATDLTAFIEQSLVAGQAKTLRDVRSWVRSKISSDLAR